MKLMKLMPSWKPLRNKIRHKQSHARPLVPDQQRERERERARERERERERARERQRERERGDSHTLSLLALLSTRHTNELFCHPFDTPQNQKLLFVFSNAPLFVLFVLLALPLLASPSIRLSFLLLPPCLHRSSLLLCWLGVMSSGKPSSGGEDDGIFFMTRQEAETWLLPESSASCKPGNYLVRWSPKQNGVVISVVKRVWIHSSVSV